MSLNNHLYHDDQQVGYIIFSLLCQKRLALKDVQEGLQLSEVQDLECLKEAKSYFRSLDLEIERCENEMLLLQADEEVRRKILSLLLMEDHRVHHDFLEKEGFNHFTALRSKVYQLLTDHYLTQDLDISVEQLKLLANKTVVAHYRQHAGFALQLENEWKQLLDITTYQIYVPIFKTIKDECDLTITDEDIFSLIRYILLHQQTTMKDMISNSKIDDVVTKVLEQIYQSTHLDFRNNETMQHSLKDHMKSLIIHYFGQEYNYNPMLRQIKQEYTLAYDMAKNVKSLLEKELSVWLSDDELGFLALHFELGMHSFMRKHLHAVVIGCREDAKTQLLVKNIEDHLHSLLVVDEVVPLKDMDSIHLASKHVIIDPTKSYHHPSMTVIGGDYILSTKQLEEFQKTVEKLNYQLLSTHAITKMYEQDVQDTFNLEDYLKQWNHCSATRLDDPYGKDYIVKLISDQFEENQCYCLKSSKPFMIDGDPYQHVLVLCMAKDQNSIISGYQYLKQWIKENKG